jgi:hypothetical protein
MNINRHNYEEFFLLYVDNELTTAERKSVEQFIQENPDLAGELDLFRQTSLVSDEAIVYKGKELLMKNVSDTLITIDNYEEWLIAYLDNELLPADRVKFESFADLHPSIKEELSVFQQTKLQPEADIIFENKQVLYRKEEKVRVITLQWWKVAVAAAIILTIGVTTYTVLNKETQIPGLVAGTGNKPADTKQNGPEKLTTDIKKEEQSLPAVRENKDAVASTTKADDKEEPVRVRKSGNENLKKKITTSATNGNDVLAKTDVPIKPIDITKDKKSIETKIIENTVADKKEMDLSKNSVAINNDVAKQNNSSTTVTNNTDKPYDNKETAQEPTTNTGAVFASNNEEGKNKKFRGFFRKATRVFEKRTNISAADDDDKVLIGVLAVRLK